MLRYLAPEIAAARWSVPQVVGSLGGPGDLGFAPEFFAPLPVTAVDCTDAMDIFVTVLAIGPESDIDRT